jgi:hypothetical protein
MKSLADVDSIPFGQPSTCDDLSLPVERVITNRPSLVIGNKVPIAVKFDNFESTSPLQLKSMNSLLVNCL